MYDVTDLGTLQDYNSSEALCLNSHGQVVGFCSPDANLGKPRRAFLWTNGKMVDLGTLGGQESVAFSINNQGLVVGVSETNQGERHAFRWSHAAGIKDLGLAEKFSAAFGINNQGSVVGRHGENILGAAGFLLSPAGMLQDIAGAGNSGALALNEKNEVTGWYFDPEFPAGFFWSGGKLTDFGSPHDWDPVAVNFSGAVVGVESFVGFHWKSGVVTWLNPFPGDTNSYARCINDGGTIVGGSFDVNGQPPFGRAAIWIGVVPLDLNTLTADMPAIKMVSANWITNGPNGGAIAGRGWVDGAIHAWMAQPLDILDIGELDIGMRGYMAVSWPVLVDGSGIGITPDGHIIPIPWTGPHSTMRRLSSAIDRLLRSIRDPKMRQQMETRLFATIEEAIRKETENIR